MYSIGLAASRVRIGKTQTSSLHIDIPRDLEGIAADIASVAYPILEQSGSLRRSRLMVRTRVQTGSPNGGSGKPH